MNETKSSVYNYIFVELADPRTRDLFLTDPLTFLGIGISYLTFVLYLGPKLMKNRKPFKLNNILIFYNIYQVLISAYIFNEATIFFTMNWHCEPLDRSMGPLARKVLSGFYVFYLAKISEFLDTIFFVLRKKQNQITFLHVYHHTFALMFSWSGLRYYPGGHGVFVGFINSFVHIIMYTYYAIAAMGPKYQKYIWWKKYITIIQLVQFVLILLHNAQLFFYDCDYPKATMFLSIPNAVLFFYLFYDFYRKKFNKNDTIEKQQEYNKKPVSFDGRHGNVRNEEKKIT